MPTHTLIDRIRSLKVSTVLLTLLALGILLTGMTVVAVGTDVTACVNTKTGATRIMNFIGGDCAKTETKLVWNIQGVKGDTGAAGAKGDKGDRGDAGPAGAQLHLYDANNQDLGIFLGRNQNGGNYYETLIPSLGLTLEINSRDYYQEAYTHTVGADFTSSDCTGDAYTSSIGFEGNAVAYMVRLPSGTRYFTLPPSNRSTQIISSHGGGGGVCTPVGTPYSQDVWTLREIALPFTEPISWPLSIMEK